MVLRPPGRGVKVAIIDTGIDVTHPCFNDAGYPNQQKHGPASLTNDKVIFAKVFNNKAANKNWTPEDLNGHGTHVAGTVACNEHTARCRRRRRDPVRPVGRCARGDAR